jgi:outer membrane murein-binding lipoprotein Lpp
LSNLKRPAVIAAACAATLLLAGCEFTCTTGSSVSSDELASQVQDSYEQQTDLALTSITCEEVDAEVGEPISCEAVNENDFAFDITGEITEYDSDNDKVKFDWEVGTVMAPGDTYAEAAQRALLNQSGAALSDVQCPERVTLKKGEEFECTATDANGDRRTVTITLTDETGGFDANLLKLPLQ